MTDQKQICSRCGSSDLEIAEEFAADYKRELNKLSDISFALLNATDGDKAEAEAMLDDFIDLLFEGGALSTWRYRILLAEIRAGL